MKLDHDAYRGYGVGFAICIGVTGICVFPFPLFSYGTYDEDSAMKKLSVKLVEFLSGK